MSRVMDGIATINSFIRTLLGVVVVGVVGAGGWLGYQAYTAEDRAKADLEKVQTEVTELEKELKSETEAHKDTTAKLVTARADNREKDQRIGNLVQSNQEKDATIKERDATILDQQDTIDEQSEVIERQKIAMRLLKQDERLALISVLDQQGEGDDLVTTIRWQEIDDDGAAIGEARNFDIRGDIVKVDAWIVKFNDEYIEKADLLRGTSICLFRRIHGEFAQPDEVHVLDQVGSLPNAYRRGEVSDFEKKIWDGFWIIANDTEKAEELGIRAAHGEVVYNKVKQGKKYKLTLRASGGLTMKPVDDNDTDATGEPAA